MEVSNFIEQEDGSAICNLEMDNEAKEFLINYAFVDILRIGLDKFELQFEKVNDNIQSETSQESASNSSETSV